MRPTIEFGARSSREAKPWICSDCGHNNGTVSKLVFDVPLWICANFNCRKRFVDDKHPLDFCLGDVLINGEKLIKKVFDQKDSKTCGANAICQVMQMGYVLNCIIHNKEIDDKMLNLDPGVIVNWYDQRYPLYASDTYKFGISHFFIKTVLMLRNEGIPLEDGSRYKIGDVSCVSADSYEAICDELADGNPLVAIFSPGVSISTLQYCLIYRPPQFGDVQKCNKACEGNPAHVAHVNHAVVLLGPACKGELRGFYFINSWGLWCPRFMIDENITEYGVAKIANTLNINPIKLWLPGERPAIFNPYRYEDEDDADGLYTCSRRNMVRYFGSCRSV